MKKYLLLILLIIPFNIKALDLYSKAYYVYDVTDNKIILEKDKDNRRPIASLTKIMSSIVAIENIEDLDARVTITQEMLNTVPWDAYIVHLKVGEEVTYRDLLYATLLPSGADAVNSLAISVGGSISNFVDMMNKKANDLNLKDTSFQNPIGMDHQNNYSTPNDLFNLFKYALENKDFKEIIETKHYKMTNGMDAFNSAMMFGNQINLNTERIIGDKTGYTTPAEFCITYEFKSHDHVYYAVLLGAPVDNFTDFKHIRDALNVIDYVDNNYDYYRLVDNNSLYKSIKVVNSNIDKYDIYHDKEIELLLDNYDKDKLIIEDDLPNEISYLNKKDEVIGYIKYYYDNELLYEKSVVLNIDIEPNITEFIKIHIIEIVALGIIIVLILLIIIYWIKGHK